MLNGLVESDPRILDCTPVIAGTQVPVQMLIEYRKAGQPLYEFLFDFPGVQRAQAKKIWAWLLKHTDAEIEVALGISLNARASHKHAAEKRKGQSKEK